jgi:hypothetical protein
VGEGPRSGRRWVLRSTSKTQQGADTPLLDQRVGSPRVETRRLRRGPRAQNTLLARRGCPERQGQPSWPACHSQPIRGLTPTSIPYLIGSRPSAARCALWCTLPIERSRRRSSGPSTRGGRGIRIGTRHDGASSKAGADGMFADRRASKRRAGTINGSGPHLTPCKESTAGRTDSRP